MGLDAYEIQRPTREALLWATHNPGHYTVRVEPLAPKQLLNDHGFYYCDTLIEPYCTQQRFIPHDDGHCQMYVAPLGASFGHLPWRLPA